MALVLDISASMNALYKSGVIQRVIERILGLAVTFDDDGQIDLLLFGTNAYQSVSYTHLDVYKRQVVLARRANACRRWSRWPPIRPPGGPP